MSDMAIHLLKKIPVRIFLPVVLTVLLFVMTIFLLILPHMEAKLMDAKREMIRELTESVLSSLQYYADREASHELTREVAQQKAIAQLRRIRYGESLKDYFWINDMHPRIVMHPYRPDLEGTDVSNFTDPRGKRLFVECVKLVKESGFGYVDYEWQWMDDPNRIVPKISFVKGFEPWGWIIGTGVYVEDVRSEIASITRKITFMCIGILAVIMGLSSYIVWRSAIIEKEKKLAEEQARLRQEQLFQAAKMVSLGTLVSGIAHEINNPITSIMLNAPTLQKVWTSVLPFLDAYQETTGDFLVGHMNYRQIRDRIPVLIANITDNAKRVKDIVSDLKDFARQKPSDLTDQVNINESVKKSVSLVWNLIKKSTDRFLVNYGSDIPLFKGNSQRLEQVIINLIVNACESLQDKSKSITVSTQYDALNAQIIVQVKDEGVGIPPEILQRIKDPFFTTKRDTGGTGLGLTISDKIIRDHMGELIFESEPSKGTTVTIRIPIRLNQNTPGYI